MGFHERLPRCAGARGRRPERSDYATRARRRAVQAAILAEHLLDAAHAWRIRCSFSINAKRTCVSP